MNETLVKMKNISKEFPGVKALEDVDLNAYNGRVMALLGENGAGKSTLMKILTGVYERSSGEIYYKGEKVNFNSPKESQEKGIGIIHQELNLLPNLTIGENIFLGREPVGKTGKINWSKLYSDSEKYLKKLKIDINPKTKIKNLSIGIKQMVEIAKALSLDAELIIMDEPTDALTDTETENLFRVINELRDENKGIIYISHRLDEIFEICDDVTILRDGKFIKEERIENINKEQMIELMVGRKLTEQFPVLDKNIGNVILEVKNLKNEYIDNVSFNVKKGEILGVAGLMGAGRTELAKTIFGLYKVSSGEVILDGKSLNINSPHDAIKYGISYVSEDRKKDGLVLGLSVKDNMTLSSLKEFTDKFGKINKKDENTICDQFIKSMSIRTPSKKQKVKNLSGGNQQKVAITKSLIAEPKVLILDEPTRGVDVGAKREIYDLINKFKKNGMAIIMISSEIPEILGMSDRIMVMNEGKKSGELDRKKANQKNIMKLAVGMKGEKIDEVFE